MLSLHKAGTTVRLAGLLVALAACTDETTEPLPTTVPPAPQVTLEAVDVPESGTVNRAVAPPVLRAINSDGTPAVNTTVNFNVLNGGTAEFSSDTSDAEGLVSPGAWTLGKSAGLNYLVATANGPSTRIATEALAGPFNEFFAPGTLQGQEFDAGTDVGPISFRAVDEFGNTVPIAGIPILLAPLEGSLAGLASAQTDSSGVATGGSWTLASAPGPQHLRGSYTVNGVPGETLITVTSVTP